MLGRRLSGTMSDTQDYARRGGRIALTFLLFSHSIQPTWPCVTQVELFQVRKDGVRFLSWILKKIVLLAN